MITDIFIKSCAKDIEWLKYSLRSIQKFCTGFRDVVLLFPDEEKEALKPLNLVTEKVHYTHERGDRYLWQQVEKLRAYAYSDADYFTYVDSDVVFTRRVSPKDFFDEESERPIVLYTPYSSLVNENGTPATPWQTVTAAALKRPVEYEFMRRHPLTASRRLLMLFDAFMIHTHKMSVEDYIMSQPNRHFSEWNALFAFSFYTGGVAYLESHFVCTEPEPIPPPAVRQFWSWSGITQDERRQIEEILK